MIDSYRLNIISVSQIYSICPHLFQILFLVDFILRKFLCHLHPKKPQMYIYNSNPSSELQIYVAIFFYETLYILLYYKYFVLNKYISEFFLTQIVSSYILRSDYVTTNGPAVKLNSDDYVQLLFLQYLLSQSFPNFYQCNHFYTHLRINLKFFLSFLCHMLFK